TASQPFGMVDALTGASLVPVLCGLIAGIAARDRWLALLYVPVLLFQLYLMISVPFHLATWTIAVWIALGFAANCRLIAWYFEGNTLRCMLGALGGCMVGSAGGMLVMMTLVFLSSGPPARTMYLLSYGLPILVVLGMTALGAVLSTRKRRRLPWP